jgi:cob(I)alamin adenosyltransferase
VKIYTKTGDEGETSLFGGARVSKDVPRIEAFGTVDELNSVIGICRAVNPRREVGKILEQVQRDLFTLGAELATPGPVGKNRSARIKAPDIGRLERHIDAFDARIPALRKFILPGGNAPAAMMHLARTVCRRAERRVVALGRRERVSPAAIIYLNRLSDLLFVLARWENGRAGIPETQWNP